MDTRTLRPHTLRGRLAWLGAAGFTIALACGGTFLARAKLLEAAAWVRHTSEVELAIAECRINLRDARLVPSNRLESLEATVSAARRVQRLTADNPQQQARIKNLLAHLDADTAPGSGENVDRSLLELGAVEGALMAARSATLARATHTGWLVLGISAASTFLILGLFVAALLRQAQALARAQADATQKGAMLRSVIEAIDDGVMAITRDRTVLCYNAAARKLLGDQFPADEFPRNWSDVVECLYEDGTAMKPEEGALARAINGLETDKLVYRTRPLSAPPEATRWISATGRPVRGGDGTVTAGVAILHDISEHKRHQDELRALSISDELTGLHNRRGFLMLAEQHARVALRRKSPFAVVFLDLNGLKAVNDALGHEAGDRLIRAAGTVIREVFRESDLVARLGGDELVALLADVGPEVRPILLARIERGVKEHNAAHNGVSGLRTPLSLSVGIAFYDPADPVSIAELMTAADQLMYADKRARRGGRTSRPSEEHPQN